MSNPQQLFCRNTQWAVTGERSRLLLARPFPRKGKIPKGHCSLLHRWHKPLEVSLTHSLSPLFWQNTPVVRELARTLPMNTQWSLASGVAQEVVLDHTKYREHKDPIRLEVLFIYYAVSLWVFVNILITAWSDWWVHVSPLKKPLSNSLWLWEYFKASPVNPDRLLGHWSERNSPGWWQITLLANHKLESFIYPSLQKKRFLPSFHNYSSKTNRIYPTPETSHLVEHNRKVIWG